MPFTVLVADDHVAVAEAFQRLLEEQGWQVRLAHSPEDVDALVSDWSPDIAMLDIEFRGSERTGFDIASAMVSSSPTTRVIFLTMHGDSVFPEVARKAGVAGFLVKDVRSSEVVQAIKTVAAGGTWFRKPRTPPSHGLTPQELKVVRLLERGLRYQEIAATMHLRRRTIQFHIAAAEKRTGAKTTSELVRIARQRGWLLLPDDSESGDLPSDA